MTKAKAKISKSNEGVEEVKTDPITNKEVHSAEEFHKAEPKKVKQKKDGTVDKRSVKLEVKKDMLIEEMQKQLNELKNQKTKKELKAEEKEAKRIAKEQEKEMKRQAKEQKRAEIEMRKKALSEIMEQTPDGGRITKNGKIDMRGRSLKCREHQERVISTMREALRKSYVEKAKKHIDESDEEPAFEIVPVPKLELIVEKMERKPEIDYKALYEAQQSKLYESDLARDMANAKRVGTKKRIQENLLKGII